MAHDVLKEMLVHPELKGTELLSHMTQHLERDIEPMSRMHDVAFAGCLCLAISCRVEHSGDKAFMVSSQLRAIMPAETDSKESATLNDVGTATGSRQKEGVSGVSRRSPPPLCTQRRHRGKPLAWDIERSIPNPSV